MCRGELFYPAERRRGASPADGEETLLYIGGPHARLRHPLTHRPGELARVTNALACKGVNLKSVAAVVIGNQDRKSVV